MPTYFSIRRARVSGFFASWIRWSTAYLFAAFRPSKNSRACGTASRAACRSSGTVAVLGASYALSHRPSACARSTSVKPRGRIRPSAISRSTLSRLIFDHLLRDVRGVNRWTNHLSSHASGCPSIQPKHGATSSASANVTDVIAAALLRQLQPHVDHTSATSSNPSSIQPVMPPIIFLTGRPSRARRTAALSAPLQCGPAQ